MRVREIAVNTIAGTTGDDILAGTIDADLVLGDAGNDTLVGGAATDLIGDTLAGGVGDDLYLIANALDQVVESAGEGWDEVQTHLATYTLADHVEALTHTGSASFTGTGNGLDNAITGGAGADTLDGGLGADTLVGGLGDDVYLVDDAGDVVVELAGEGADTVLTTLTAYVLGDHVESLTHAGPGDFTGTGNALDNTVTGGAGADTLAGLDGDDTLDGGLGDDTLVGGLGDDSYVVDSTGDLLVEQPGEGTDTVVASVSWTLQADIENLTLTGTAATGTGNAADNALTGNAAANLLTGLEGDDTLDGGAGADTLVGGLGDDTYVVDNAADQVVEAAAEGTDTVRSGVSWTLGANLERLVLTGTGSINGTGNDLDNVITGNGGNNTLDGGAGDDTLIGGAGNDVYIVDSLGDVVTEVANQGSDEVRTALAAWTLGANLERLVFTGTGSFDGTGNELANTLTGQAGDDTLSGLGGNDTLTGGAGADTLDGGLGTDTASYATSAAGVAVDLTAGSASGGDATGDALIGIENLTGGNGADTLTGDAGVNVLTGNAGADTLTGLDGNDTLIGGAGADVLDGGSGADTASYATSGAPIAVDLAAGTGSVGDAAGDILIGIESLTGGNGADTLLGDGGANRIDGGNGNDTLQGRGGNDSLVGGSGTDTAVYLGSVRDYVATKSGTTWTIAAPAATGEGTDTLTGMEYAQFSDMLVHLDRNNAPVVPGGLTASTDEDAAPLSVNLLTGVWDFENDALSVTGLTQTIGSPVTVSLAGGVLTLDPAQLGFLAAGETADLTFDFGVSDGTDTTARSLTVTVAGRNDAPVVTGPLAVTTNEDADPLLVDLLQGASDPDTSDTLTVATFAQTGGRAVSFSSTGGVLTLDPGQFNDLGVGESETVTFGYSVGDGTASVAQTLAVTVQGRNDAPVAVGDSFSTAYATPLLISKTSLLANDYDPEGTGLTFQSIGGVGSGILQAVDNDHYLFFPAAGFSGNTSVQYTVADVDGATATGTVTLTVGAAPVATASSMLVSTDEMKVSDTPIGSYSGIARLNDGKRVIVWAGQTGNGDWDIYAQLYNDEGQAVGNRIPVNTVTAGTQFDPIVGALSDGGFVVGWSGQDGSQRGVFARRFDEDGTEVGDQFRVNDTTANDQVATSVIGLTNGGFAFAWSSLAQDGDGSWASIGRVFKADGTSQTSEFRLNQTTAWDQSMPVLVEVSPTEIMAVWASRGQDGDGWGGIMARRFDSSTGSATTNELARINVYTTSDQYRPQVIKLENGEYVVAWRSLEQDGHGWGVFGRRLDANGTATGGEFRINNYTYLNQYQVNLAALDGGGFVAVWESQGQDGSGWSVVAQRFNDLGQRVGVEFMVAEHLTGDQSSAQVIAGANGAFTVTWNSNHSGVAEVYTRTFTPDHDLVPVVVANSVSLAATVPGQTDTTQIHSVAADALFAVGHPQGAEEVRAGFGTLARYRFRDDSNGADSGYFTFDGVKMPALQTIEVLADQLDRVRFVSGTAGSTDTVAVAGFDGLNWSAWQSATVASMATTGATGATVAGRENQVNATAGGGAPEMARLADGGYVVAWHAVVSTSGDTDIYARRYDASGRPVGDEFRVNTVAGGVQSSPVVGALADGGFVIGWNGPQSGARDVLAQRYDAAGKPVGTEQVINQTITSDQVVSSITGLSNGGFVVGWSSLGQDGDGSWAAMARLFNADGHSQSSEILLNSYTTWDQHRPMVAQINDAEFAVTWTSRGQDGSGFGGIMFRRFSTATGAAIIPEVQVNTTTLDDQFRSDIVALSDNSFVIVWNSLNQDGGGWGVYGQRIANNGTKLGGEFRINTTTASDQNNVRLAALEDGGFVAVWDSAVQDGSGSGVYGQRFSIAGNTVAPQKVGTEIAIAQITTGNQTFPSVVGRPDGGFTVSWQSTPSSAAQVESRTFSAAGSPLWVAGTAGLDTLTGQGGDDIVIGGAGNDTLTGGAGADAFRFTATTEGPDTITDFQTGIDRIEVVGTAFGGLPVGALDPGRFALNATADADDRFVFNTTTRILSYDADGSGVGAAVSLAYLTVGTISAADIRVVS